MDIFSVLQFLGAPKLWADARRYRHTVNSSLVPSASRSNAVNAQTSLVMVGYGLDGTRVMTPSESLIGHGLIAGATGAGKSWAATAFAQQLVHAQGRPLPPAFGVVDPKGDLFERLMPVLSSRRSIALNFGLGEPVPYALLKPRAEETPEQLVERRMEVFSDLLGRDSVLSLRMGRMLRNLLSLAAEHNLAFPLIEFLLTNADLCRALGLNARHARVRAYFDNDFQRELNTTRPALQARLDFVLRNDILRLSFAADDFVDLRAAMDTGISVLCNVGGPGLSKSSADLIQSLVLSDLRQAVFARSTRELPYLWFVDEAQQLFARSSDTEHLTALLTMSRSFGVHLILMTQSLIAACPNRDLLNQLQTNIRWLVMLRSGPDDARLLEAAMPVTGRVVRHRYERGRLSYMTEEQERQMLLREISNLPQRTAYFWSRGRAASAMKIQLPLLTPTANGPMKVEQQRESPAAIERQLLEQARRVRAMTASRSSDRQGIRKVPSARVLARLEERLRSSG